MRNLEFLTKKTIFFVTEWTFGFIWMCNVYIGILYFENIFAIEMQQETNKEQFFVGLFVKN